MIKLDGDLNLVAIYAAVVSTLSFGWQVYQWLKSGPNLKGRLNVNMIRAYASIGDAGIADKFILINVVNTGKVKTTITGVRLEAFNKSCRHLRSIPVSAAVLARDIPGYDIPYILDPGGEFKGMCLQDDHVIKMSNEFHLYVCVDHSFSEKPLRIKIPPILK